MQCGYRRSSKSLALCGSWRNFVVKVAALTERHSDAELNALGNFYESVEKDAQQVVRKSTRDNKLNCKQGCAGCCIDKLTVSTLEAAYILARADRQNIGTRRQTLHTPAVPLVDPALDALVRENSGRCAFLADDHSCQIYDHRPYVCRHFGLPLRWVLPTEHSSGEDGGVVKHEGRDICPINDDCLSKPVEELDPLQCYPVDEVWEILEQLQLQLQLDDNWGEKGEGEGEDDEGGEEDEEDEVALRDLYDFISAH
jgi:Fe-S-cluster containining protein